jgi:ribonucleotide reductase alpha subunit
MQAVVEDKIWELKDPNDKVVREEISARSLWQRILQVRFRTGEPYINFIDEANRHLPEYQKDLGLKIHGSNLCLSGKSKLNVLVDNVLYPTLSLKEVVDLFKSGKEILVLSYNLETKDIEYKKIIAGDLMFENAEVLEIIDEESGKTITCTPNHKVFTKNRGYVMAKDLKENDELIFC